MSEREDHRQLADDAEREAKRLEQRSQELDQEIGETRQEWERKRASEAVPGAPPRREDTDRDAPGDEVNPEDAAREEHESPDAPARTDPGR